MTAAPVRVLVPAGMLGAGFTAEAIDRGIELGADVIAIDGGSTDPRRHRRDANDLAMKARR